jgi:hypothetical protein
MKNPHAVTCAKLYKVSYLRAMLWRALGDARYKVAKSYNYLKLYGG